MEQKSKTILVILGCVLLFVSATPSLADRGSRHETSRIELSQEHISAAECSRRLMLHYDYSGHTMLTTPWGEKGIHQLEEILDFYSSPYEEANAQFLDTIVYELGEGPAVWPSKIVPRAKVVFPKWWETGIDPLGKMIEVAQKHRREVFLTYRLNGTDVEEDAEYQAWRLPAIKQQHPEWLVETPWGMQLWNFAFQGVRDHKVSILREVAGMYDIDGLQIDLARSAILFPPGQQWKNRKHMTAFMRQLREALLQVAEQRGRPLLVAVRIPENLIGCHFDGMDVETWVREGLVDILIPGCGASDIDVPAFRELTRGTHVKVYPSWDTIHPTDGYRDPPVEYWRGLYSKWWELGADGVHTFNLSPASPFLREIGDRDGMRLRDKIFIVQRRSGSHGKEITGDPYDWETPRHQYFMTYMTAPLPAIVDASGKVDTLLKLTVTDRVQANADKIDDLTLQLLLSDVAAEGLPEDLRIARTYLWTMKLHPAKNEPPLKGIERRIEVRVNNLKLEPPRVEEGWLIFDVRPQQLAWGENLIGVRVSDHPPDHRQEIRIEKVELKVDYRTP